MLLEERTVGQEVSAFEKKLESWLSARDSRPPTVATTGSVPVRGVQAPAPSSMPPAVVAFEVCSLTYTRIIYSCLMGRQAVNHSDSAVIVPSFSEPWTCRNPTEHSYHMQERTISISLLCALTVKVVFTVGRALQ